MRGRLPAGAAAALLLLLLLLLAPLQGSPAGAAGAAGARAPAAAEGTPPAPGEAERLPVPGRAAEPAPAPELLRLGDSLAGDFRDGRPRQAYAVDLGAGEYARVAVTMLGAAVRIVVRSPAGEPLQRVASPTDRYGVLPASLVADTAGRYLVEVEPLSATEAAAGGYGIRLESRRPAVPDDRERAQAEGMLGAAGELIYQGRPADLERAAALGQAALPISMRLDDRPGEAAARYLIGLSRMMANRHAEAAPFLARAEELWRGLGDAYGLSKALNQLGRLRRYQGDTAGALAAFEEAIALKQATGQAYGEAHTLYNLARMQADLGRLPAATASYEKAIAIYHAQSDRSGEALILDALGGLHERQGEAAAALHDFDRALALAHALDNVNLEAEAQDRLGRLRLQLGQLHQALDAFAAAVDGYRAAGNFASEGQARLDLAELLDAVGEPEEGSRLLQDAVGLLRDPRDRARAELLAGRIAAAAGRIDQALPDVEAALATSRAMQYPEGEAEALCARAFLVLDHLDRLDRVGPLGRLDPPGQADRVGSLAPPDPPAPPKGRDRLGPQDLSDRLAALPDRAEPDAVARAVADLDLSLAIAERIGSLAGQAESWRGLGRARAALGDAAAAESAFARALAVARRLQDVSAETRVLEDLARSRQARGDLAAAGEAGEQALARIESLHGRVAGDHLRASHLAAQRQVYETEVDVLEQLSAAASAAGGAAAYEARAFETAERARARGMLDFLDQAQVDLRQGDPALAREEESLRLELNAKGAARAGRLADPAGAAEVAALDRDIAALAGRYDLVEARLAASIPGYASLRAPAVHLADLQREALDADTVLLEYFLAEPRSYLWRVAPDSLQSFALPGRARLEALAVRVHEELAQPPGGDAERRRRDLGELSRLLLGPVAAGLEPGERLAVVADGALLYVPFAALPLPEPPVRVAPSPAAADPGDRFAAAPPLLVSHEVIQLPSAAVVRELRRLRDERPRAAAALAVVADPVFDGADPRLRTARLGAPDASDPAAAAVAGVAPAPPSAAVAASASAAPVASLTAAASPGTAPAAKAAAPSMAADLAALRRPGGGARFARLPWTRREADVAAAEARGRQVLLALDFQANRELATAGGLSRYRVVHFATHGVLDMRRPALSGLVLSQVDERGRPRDGFLRLLDVYRLRLDADLVVLSGCETALGETVRGEGIVGLTRGFFHAGASEVLASLWPIRDRATAELMQRFYHALLGGHVAPAAALRQAQLSLWREPAWHDAYFWAAFVLQGDWRVPPP